MERGDLVVQPNWSWHNHVNESNRDSVWIDALDVGLMAMLRTMFQEPHPAEQVKLFNSATDNTVRNPANLAPPGSSPKRLIYKWRDTLPALKEMLAEDKSPYDGRCLEYRDPATGGPTFPTFSCWIQMLDPGERTLPHRHTANHLCHGFSGSGVIEVEGTEMAWEEGDFMVVPNWSWHRHINSSDSEPAILFSTTDRPAPGNCSGFTAKKQGTARTHADPRMDLAVGSGTSGSGLPRDRGIPRRDRRGQPLNSGWI